MQQGFRKVQRAQITTVNICMFTVAVQMYYESAATQGNFISRPLQHNWTRNKKEHKHSMEQDQW